MKWSYEVQPARITGEIEAASEDEAVTETTDDAIRQAVDSIVAGTWDMRKADDD